MTKRRKLAMIIALIMSVSLLACSSEKFDSVKRFLFNSDEDISFDSYSENPNNLGEDAKTRDIKIIPAPPESLAEIFKYDIEDVYESDEEDESETGTFIMLEEGEIGSNLHQYIMYDPDTMVMYTYISKGYDDGVVFNVMYNADGTPKLYSPDTETE